MEYIFMQPPFEVKPFKEMTKMDAQKHFDWYVGNIPNRIEMLRNAYEVIGDSRKEDLDFSSESLIKVWNWYINKAEINEKSKEEIESEKNKLPEWVVRNIGSKKISLGWMSIAMDIAIYFSECFVSEFASIKWGIISKSKSLAYVNKPVLIGFKAGVELDATNIIRNLTLKVADGEKDSEALLKLYKVWIENI